MGFVSRKTISYNITSNGSLLTDEIIKFMIEHDFSLRISLDGPKEINDINRIYHDGQGKRSDGSYEKYKVYF